MDVWLVKCFASGFASAKVVFQYFLLNLFKNLNLCTSYIKQVMNVFSFVQWTIYFHSANDKIFHSTQLRLIDWNISPFTLRKYLYHCTHKHSLFVYQYCPVLILWCHGGGINSKRSRPLYTFTLKLNSYSNASVFLSLCRMRISVFLGQERLTDRSISKRYLKSDMATWVEKSSTSRAIHTRDTGFYWSSENALHERFITSSLNENATAHRKAIKKKRLRSSMNSA